MFNKGQQESEINSQILNLYLIFHYYRIISVTSEF